MDEELEEVDENNLDEEVVEQDIVEDENEEDYELEDTEQESEEEQQEEAEVEIKENPLKKALNAERAKRKQLEKENKLLKQNNRKSTYDTLIERGIEKELAKTLSDAIDKPNKKVDNLEFKIDLLKASKKREFADIEDYEDEVKNFVDKGLTIEQAYYTATGNKHKSVENTKSEIKREYEARMKAKKQRQDILDIDTSGNSTDKGKRVIKYTRAEASAAQAAGMTIEEYKKIQNMADVEEYMNYKSSKAK